MWPSELPLSEAPFTVIELDGVPYGLKPVVSDWSTLCEGSEPLPSAGHRFKASPGAFLESHGSKRKVQPHLQASPVRTR